MKMRGFANFKNSLEQEVYLYIKDNLKETECTPVDVIFIKTLLASSMIVDCFQWALCFNKLTYDNISSTWVCIWLIFYKYLLTYCTHIVFQIRHSLMYLKTVCVPLTTNFDGKRRKRVLEYNHIYLIVIYWTFALGQRLCIKTNPLSKSCVLACLYAYTTYNINTW